MIETDSVRNKPDWKGLYKIAGITALISEVVILFGAIFFFIWPYAPGSKSTAEIFQLLQSSPFGGLVSLDLFLLVGDIFSIALFLGLYISLKDVNESYALIALVVGLIGVVLLIPARPLLEMLSLSNQYASATGEAARSQLLAAGTSLLALFDGIGWFLSNLLGGLSLLLSSILMLRSKVFSKPTAYVGMITNAAVCGFFIPVLGNFLLLLSLPGYMIWYFQLARGFFRIGRRAHE